MQQQQIFEQEKLDLKTLNNHWEKSVKMLETTNNTLESQLYSKEDTVSHLKQEIQCIETEKNQESHNPHISFDTETLDSSCSPPKFCLEISQRPSLTFEKKPNIKKKLKIVIVAGEEAYYDAKTIQLKENNTAKRFEFDHVIKRDNLAQEVDSIIKNIKLGGNSCIINYSAQNREKILLEIFGTCISNLVQLKAQLSCLEIVGDSYHSLLSDHSLSIDCEITVDLLEIYSDALKRLSKAKHHTLLTLRIGSSVLQVLDVAMLNLQQTLPEGLSINSSLFYLEELLVNISHNTPINFDSNVITKQLYFSMSQYSFSCVFLHCENFSHIGALTFGARIQAVSHKKKKNVLINKELSRTMEILERERESNLKIMRTIEKARRDIEVYSNIIRDKETMIYHLNEKIRHKAPLHRGNNTGSTPVKSSSGSRLPTPKSSRKNNETQIVVTKSY